MQRDTVRQLLDTHGVPYVQVARHLGIHKTTFTHKMDGERGWKPAEVLALHDYLKGRRVPHSLRGLLEMCA